MCIRDRNKDDFNKELNDDQKIESGKETEGPGDEDASLSENKNNSNKENKNNNNKTNNKYMEMKTEKRHQRKLINTCLLYTSVQQHAHRNCDLNVW